MTVAGTFPYLYRSARGAWAILVGGLVAVLLGLLAAIVNLFSANPALDWRALLLLAFGVLGLHLGAGSLRGQHRDAVRHDAAPPED